MDLKAVRTKRKIQIAKLEVLLLNSHVHLFGHGKLCSKWEGPYLVLHAMDHGTVTL
jgi:hypothetical protein